MLVEVVVVMWETKRRARETFAASSGCSGGKLKVTISKKKRSKSNISTMCGCGGRAHRGGGVDVGDQT